MNALLMKTKVAGADGSRTVLHVDDERSAREAFRRHLRRKYKVVSAANGWEALDLLGEYPFDAVVLDLRMPGMHGFAALKKLRETYPGLPVLILTGYATEASLNLAMSLGCCGFLEKPYDDLELEVHLETAMARRVPGDGAGSARWEEGT